MDQQLKERINLYFEKNRDALLKDLCDVISIPSTRGESTDEMPYGPGPYAALKHMEEVLEREGLRVLVWDNRAVTGDLTGLPSGLDILAHLDVVPCNHNWTVCEPYAPVLKDDKLYGRGSIDDKGPAIAALYAMKCVKELGIPLKKNVRLILGTDEECGSTDLEYYYSQVPEAPMTFTPDANFPLINLEKGRFPGEFDAEFCADPSLPYIASAEAGHTSNVVPESGNAIVVGMSEAELLPYLRAGAEKTSTSFETEALDGCIRITCKGVSAHASTPEMGNNALTALLELLVSLPCHESQAFRTLKALQKLVPHGDYHGTALGIDMSDELSGRMTFSPDILRFDENSLYLMYDARCPVCATEENTKAVSAVNAAKAGLKQRDNKMVLPHYVPEDSELIRSLLKVYEEWTGEPGKAMCIGGGTYVHDLKNGVAFGCEMEGIDNHLHAADEFITMDQLMLSAKIFTSAILELCS